MLQPASASDFSAVAPPAVWSAVLAVASRPVGQRWPWLHPSEGFGRQDRLAFLVVRERLLWSVAVTPAAQELRSSAQWLRSSYEGADWGTERSSGLRSATRCPEVNICSLQVGLGVKKMMLDENLPERKMCGFTPVHNWKQEEQVIVIITGIPKMYATCSTCPLLAER